MSAFYSRFLLPVPFVLVAACTAAEGPSPTDGRTGTTQQANERSDPGRGGSVIPPDDRTGAGPGLGATPTPRDPGPALPGRGEPGRAPQAEPLAPDVVVTFSELNAKIISTRCNTACHDTNYDMLVSGATIDEEPYVTPFNPSASWVYWAVSTGYMPQKNATDLDALEASMFFNWISQGALNN